MRKIKYYLIHNTDPRRKKQMIDLFQNFGICNDDVIWLNYPNKNEITEELKQKVLLTNSTLNLGYLSCSYKHYLALQDIVKNEYPLSVIMEDNIGGIDYNVPEQIEKYLNELPKNWDILFDSGDWLPYNQHYPEKYTTNKLIYPANYKSRAAQFYMLTLNCAKKLASNYLPFNDAPDWIMNKLFPVLDIQSFVVEPPNIHTEKNHISSCTNNLCFESQNTQKIINRADAVNFVIKKYKYENPLYLEIGVFTGATFINVNTIHKDGVDTEDYTNCEYVNYKMTSDNFFSQNKKKYDIIFIDGLHTAYQVSKDIQNSINWLNDGGVILLDDVYPHNEFEQKGLDLSNKGANTGDVWKAVCDLLNQLIQISSDVIFFPDIDRGMISFKLKNNNIQNITINQTIPTLDNGIKQEWNLYKYDVDFPMYFNKILSYKVGSI